MSEVRQASKLVLQVYSLTMLQSSGVNCLGFSGLGFGQGVLGFSCYFNLCHHDQDENDGNLQSRLMTNHASFPYACVSHIHELLNTNLVVAPVLWTAVASPIAHSLLSHILEPPMGPV